MLKTRKVSWAGHVVVQNFSWKTSKEETTWKTGKRLWCSGLHLVAVCCEHRGDPECVAV
jgi:hypothetical protein